MEQKVTHSFANDENGDPAGGTSVATGLTVTWQNGPLGRGEGRSEPNGAFVETIMRCALDRLEFYQASKFACWENAIAIAALKTALLACESRTAKREERGVEGTHEA